MVEPKKLLLVVVPSVSQSYSDWQQLLLLLCAAEVLLPNLLLVEVKCSVMVTV